LLKPAPTIHKATAEMYDEMYDAEGQTRRHYEALGEWLASLPPKVLEEKRREADLLFHRVGITFAVYGDDEGTERLIPFDTIPRIIPGPNGSFRSTRSRASFPRANGNSSAAASCSASPLSIVFCTTSTMRRTFCAPA
jgi:hypothetical protein